MTQRLLTFVLILCEMVVCCGAPQTSAGRHRAESALDELAGELPAMGVLFRYRLFGEPVALQHAEKLIKETLEELEQTFSDYRNDSEVSKLAQAIQVDVPFAVSPMLWNMCRKSLALSEVTNGAFDITVGPVSHLWRSAIKRNRLPDSERIETALKSVGYQKLEILPEHQMVFHAPGMKLDFGGIVKGFAADLILQRLEKELGISIGLVDASGDIAVRGIPPGRTHWNVQIASIRHGFGISLELPAGGVATSGSIKQFLEINGVVHSHIVDPRTGHACQGTSQVTVFAPDGMQADALASAFSVLEPDEAIQLADSLSGVAVRVIFSEKDAPNRLHAKESRRFREFQKSGQ